MIWRHTFPRERRLRTRSFRTLHEMGLIFPFPPIASSVNEESRMETLKQYELFDIHQNGRCQIFTSTLNPRSGP